MLPSGLPEHIDAAEPLSRFLTSDSQFNRTMAKPSAFMPGPADGNTSVFRLAADPLPAVWDIADREIGTERRVRAVAVLTAGDVRRVKLEVEADEPPPRHANITGWPHIASDPERMRAERKEFALLLAQAATLHLR
ncbi:MAG: hypothetical protein RIQ60_2369 [Pseudomonadota bacterium]|jgi:hypothetical protein